MGEYNVTPILDEDEPLVGSRFELGDNAGPMTWENRLDAAERWGDSMELDEQDAREHFVGYGAWTREEIAAWSTRELQAAVIQDAASALREGRDEPDPEYPDAESYGGGKVFRGDVEGSEGFGKLYIYLGT